MTDATEYDEDAAHRELAVYRTEPATERRRRVVDHLALDGDETVLSAGCGPGLEPAAIAEALGPDGRVLGLDESTAMLGLARDTRGADDRIALCRGDAAALPLATGCVDAVAAVQLLEYVPDPSATLAECARVLASDGRLVALDTDWRTFVWRAADDERSRTVLDAWAERCPHPRIGSGIGPLLAEAGFTVETVAPFTIVERTLADSFFGHNLPFVLEYAEEQAAIGPEMAAAWADDVRQRDEAGETFVSLTQYAHVATPAGPASE